MGERAYGHTDKEFSCICVQSLFFPNCISFNMAVGYLLELIYDTLKQYSSEFLLQRLFIVS